MIFYWKKSDRWELFFGESVETVEEASASDYILRVSLAEYGLYYQNLHQI